MDIDNGVFCVSLHKSDGQGPPLAMLNAVLSGEALTSTSSFSLPSSAGLAAGSGCWAALSHPVVLSLTGHQRAMAQMFINITHKHKRP